MFFCQPPSCLRTTKRMGNTARGVRCGEAPFNRSPPPDERCKKEWHGIINPFMFRDERQLPLQTIVRTYSAYLMLGYKRPPQCLPHDTYPAVIMFQYKPSSSMIRFSQVQASPVSVRYLMNDGHKVRNVNRDLSVSRGFMVGFPLFDFFADTRRITGGRFD